METLLQLDRDISLYINHWRSDWANHLMLFVTGKYQWIPLYLLLFYFLIKDLGVKKGLLALFCIGLVFLLADRVSSGFFKPFFERLRPCHDPSMQAELQLLPDTCGGRFGFVSSHAANTFGLAFFLFFLWKQKTSWVWAMLFWAGMVSYSRVYLGVHYLGDILCGGLLGFGFAFTCYKLYLFLEKKTYFNETGPKVSKVQASQPKRKEEGGRPGES